MGIDRAWEDVRAFHLAFDHPAPEAPELLHADLVQRRANWIEEEADELREAATIAEQADAFIDIIFALGGLVNLGVRPERLWDIVQKRQHRRPGEASVHCATATPGGQAGWLEGPRPAAGGRDRPPAPATAPSPRCARRAKVA